MPTKTKIIIRVLGGLGNQLFIYAFARALSLRYNLPVNLETHTGFVRDSYKRNYRLKHYNIQLKLCSWHDSLYFPFHKRFKILSNFLYRDAIYITEKNFKIETFEKILESTDKVFLDGYWQKEEYFAEYLDIIRNDLTPEFLISSINKAFADEMKNCNSVALHVRRNQYSNVLDLDYYLNSMAQIKKQVKNPVFFIFSDDMEWCKEHLKAPEKLIYINHNMNDEMSELWLMSQCKHYIVANSTFSRWGATLSENSQKKIIEPLR
jgi:hypothetical protein